MSEAAHEPLACATSAFTPAESAHSTKLQQRLPGSRGVRELPKGFALFFVGDDRTWQGLAEFVSLERRCCPFLSFTLIREGEASTLPLTGPEGTKAFLLSELGLT